MAVAALPLVNTLSDANILIPDTIESMSVFNDVRE
jgi:hypothetical protein